jgi:hypothetical protein
VAGRCLSEYAPGPGAGVMCSVLYLPGCERWAAQLRGTSHRRMVARRQTRESHVSRVVTKIAFPTAHVRRSSETIDACPLPMPEI